MLFFIAAFEGGHHRDLAFLLRMRTSHKSANFSGSRSPVEYRFDYTNPTNSMNLTDHGVELDIHQVKRLLHMLEYGWLPSQYDHHAGEHRCATGAWFHQG